MTDVSSIRDLVNLWPKRADLACDLRAVCPGLSVTVHQCHKWAETGSIPARYHYAVLQAARRRGFDISGDLLARLHWQEQGAA